MSRKARPVVLVDADSIVYRVGHAAQKRVIHDVVETDEGELFPIDFEGRQARNKYFKDHPTHHSVSDPLEDLIVEPIEFCLRTVKQTIERLKQLGTPVLYLTGKGNYRERIATIVPYKGNRDPADRPVHYDAVRRYMVDYHGAVVVDNREADDEISILAHRCYDEFKSYIIASIDKDLDQIPGRHFNYAKDVEYAIDEEEADRWFYCQILSGDPGDNIPGCWKIGATKAADIVDSIEPWTERWDVVVSQYEASQQKTGCPYAHLSAELVAQETAQLVYLQQKEGELWMPPGIPFGRVDGDKDD